SSPQRLRCRSSPSGDPLRSCRPQTRLDENSNEPRGAGMSDQEPSPVVVAGGHDEGDAALEYAAAEAVRLACGLHLVQFVRAVPQGPDMVLVDVADVGRVGRQSLEAALDRARALIADD